MNIRFVTSAKGIFVNCFQCASMNCVQIEHHSLWCFCDCLYLCIHQYRPTFCKAVIDCEMFFLSMACISAGQAYNSYLQFTETKAIHLFIYVMQPRLLMNLQWGTIAIENIKWCVMTNGCWWVSVTTNHIFITIIIIIDSLGYHFRKLKNALAFSP